MPHSLGTKNKTTGSFYTPQWCVDILLRMSGFDALSPKEKLSSYVIDPACGDGAILCRVIENMIEVNKDVEVDEISQVITERLFGFELSAEEADRCRDNICAVTQKYGIDVSRDDLSIFAGDAFVLAKEYLTRFDFVIGNPPYVRIHNIEKKPDSAYITGMCDLYLAFYDLGQQLLSKSGTLCFIAPSSWTSSAAGATMREDLCQRHAIKAVLDFEHFQVFDNATAYTAIVALDKGSSHARDVAVYPFNPHLLKEESPSFVSDALLWEDGLFYTQDIENIRSLLSFDIDTGRQDIKVRNGYATMRDATFISKKSRKDCRAAEIEVVKASKGERMFAIYPYDDKGELLSLETLRHISVGAAEHLEADKDALLSRSKVSSTRWWGYGRSQGIADTYKNKLAIQSIVRPDKGIVIKSAPAGTGVFGGIYVMGIDEDTLRRAVCDERFWLYIKALAKYKSGGYYTFGGKDLEKYLRWWAQGDNNDVLAPTAEK